MTNKITVNIAPIVFVNIKKNSLQGQVTQMLAINDLECSKQGILRNLTYNLPESFNEHVYLTLSINIKTFKVKIDYSAIKTRKTIALVKRCVVTDI